MSNDQYCHNQEILNEVLGERIEQVKKWGFQNISPAMFLTILTEETGEVSKEIIERHFSQLNPCDAANLRAELIQVAAVAVQFIEFIDVKVRQS